MSGDRLDPVTGLHETDDKLEQLARTMEFIQNRVDHVAEWVVEWMPPEDNEQHHNAIEHLRRVWEEAERARRTALEMAEWPVNRIRKREPDADTYSDTRTR